LNSQPIEKLDLRADGSLDVHSIFYTIQGEGPFTGQPAIFLRLWGCNLQCPGCDTDYTSARERVSVLHLCNRIYELIEDECPGAPLPLLVITGGEPFRQNITVLANLMVSRGFKVQVETNGTLPPDEDLFRDVAIVCSPKTGKINLLLEKRITALKYVVKAGCIDRKDGLPIRALDHPCSPVVAKPPTRFDGKIYLQPFDEGNPHATRHNMNAAVNACKAFGHTLQIQTHKIAGIE
jgi:7-carboxy-7-deazaguanine synthase